MIFILLPAYNEGENILPLLNQTAKEASAFFAGTGLPYPVHAIVVNDGSGDNTHEQAASFEGPIQTTLIDHPRNQGLSAALKTGIDFILQNGADDDIVITLDADGTHKPVYMFKLAHKLSEGFDVVVASRYAAGGREIGVNFYRHILSMGARCAIKPFSPKCLYGIFPVVSGAFALGLCGKP